MKKIFKFKNEVFAILVLVVVAAVICRSLFQDHLLVSDDYLFHAARTANYYLALKQGQFPPRWAPNLNVSFGYPAFLYTYHLPYAVAAVIHSMHFSIQQSLNLTVYIFVVVGMIGAYCLARYKKLSQVLSLSLGLVYVLNPYILLNIFWRGALGEIVFYCLLPLFFWLVDVIVNTKPIKWSGLYIVFLAIIISALVLSHVISLFVLGVLTVGYVSVQAWPITKHLHAYLNLLVAGLLAFLLSSWYLLPAQLEKNLIQFDSSKLATVYQQQFLHILDIFGFVRTLQSNDFFLNVIQVGPLLLLMIGLIIWQIISKKNFSHQGKKQLWMWGTVLVVSLFLTLSQSKFLWDSLGFLRVMQFPWRFLWVSNVALYFLLLEYSKLFSSKTQMIVIIVLLVCALWSAWAYAQPKGFFGRSDYEWYEADTTGSSFNEFTPVGAQDGYNLSDKVILDQGSGSVSVDSWNGTTMKYSTSSSIPSTVVQHTLYFPGWIVTIDGQSVTINSHTEKYPGLISFQVPEGTHSITTSFSGTTIIRQIGLYFSFLGCALTVIVFMWYEKIIKKFV